MPAAASRVPRRSSRSPSVARFRHLSRPSSSLPRSGPGPGLGWRSPSLSPALMPSADREPAVPQGRAATPCGSASDAPLSVAAVLAVPGGSSCHGLSLLAGARANGVSRRASAQQRPRTESSISAPRGDRLDLTLRQYSKRWLVRLLRARVSGSAEVDPSSKARTGGRSIARRT